MAIDMYILSEIYCSKRREDRNILYRKVINHYFSGSLLFYFFGGLLQIEILKHAKVSCCG